MKCRTKEFSYSPRGVQVIRAWIHFDQWLGWSGRSWQMKRRSLLFKRSSHFVYAISFRMLFGRHDDSQDKQRSRKPSNREVYQISLHKASVSWSDFSKISILRKFWSRASPTSSFFKISDIQCHLLSWRARFRKPPTLSSSLRSRLIICVVSLEHLVQAKYLPQ